MNYARVLNFDELRLEEGPRSIWIYLAFLEKEFIRESAASTR